MSTTASRAVPLAPAPSVPGTRALAGGPAARSVIPYVVLALFALGLKLELLRADAFVVLDGVGALLVSVIALFAARLVLNRTVFRRCADRPAPLWVVIGAGLVQGIVTVLPFVGVMVWTDVDLSVAPLPGLLSSAVVRCMILFPLITYLVGLREWYRTERERAERELVRAEAARMEAGEAVEATRALMIETARRELGPTQREAGDLLRVAALSEAPGDVTRAAESLRTTARSAVRSTSHDLWVDEGSAATIRWRSVVPEAIRRYPLPLLLVSVLTALAIVARANTSVEPWLLSLVAVLSGVAIVAAIYLAGRLVIARAPAAAAVVTTVAAVGAPVAALFASTAVLGRTPAPVTVIGLTLFIATVTVASSVVLMVRDSGAAVIQALVDDRAMQDAQQAALEVVNARLSRELATHLHGTVQPQLMAASVALDAAVDRGDPDAIARAVAQAEAALGVGIDSPDRPRSRPLGEVVASVTDRWQAMLPLRVDIDGSNSSGSVPDGVTRVLDECLNNALVHGGATQAVVRITQSTDAWVVEVTDDGRGPAGGAPGLGTALLDDATQGEWSLTDAAGGGAVVRAVIPQRMRTPAG